MKKGFTFSICFLWGFIFLYGQFFYASNKPTAIDPFNKTKPVATEAEVNAEFQKTFEGLLKTASNLPPIVEPTQEQIARLPRIYADPNNYYKRYGLSYDQAVQLYIKSGSHLKNFRTAYREISDTSKKNNVSIEMAFQAYVSGKPIVVQVSQAPIRQQGIVKQEMSVVTQAPKKPSVLSSQSQQQVISAQKPSEQKPIGQIAQQVSQVSSIEPPTGPQFTDAYYKAYGLTAAQAHRLYQLSQNDLARFKNNYNKVVLNAKNNNRPIGDVFEAMVAQATSAKNPVPGRPAKNIWTQSIFGYIPAGGKETIESRVDKAVYGTGRFVADMAAKPLEKITLWTESEYLDQGGYSVANPDAGKKFTLLDAVDSILAYPLIRTSLEFTIIGPLDVNKDLKMRQFIMMLLVTHYNSYKLILSPMGALNFAVNRILFPIKAASSIAKVSTFLMRQALTVFNQYNLNGGNLEQALSNQAANLVVGKIGSVVLGEKTVASGTNASTGLIQRGLGAVKRGFGALFKSK